MSFGILNLLEKAASMAVPAAVGAATGNPLAGMAASAAMSGGKAALSGATPDQALMSAGMSGATSALGAGAGALGGAAGEAVGEGFRGVGEMAGKSLMGAGIGALRGASPQQIAMAQAEGLIPYGIAQLAQGGAVTPALWASRAGYEDGGEVEGPASADASTGGGWGDAVAPGGGYMGDTGGYAGWGGFVDSIMDSRDTGGPTSDMGWGNERDGMGIADTGGWGANEFPSAAPIAPAASVVPEAPKLLPYIAPPPPPRVFAPLVTAPAAQSFRPAASPFGAAPVMTFARGGRVGYADGEYVDFDVADPETSAVFRGAGYPGVPLPPPVPPEAPPVPERDWMDKTGDWWDRNKKWAAPVGIVGGLTALGTLGTMLSPKAKAPVKKSREQLQAEYPLVRYSGPSAVAAPTGYRPGISPEWNYFPRGYAKGGGIGALPGGEGVRAMEKDPEERAMHGRRVMDAAEAALKNQHPEPQSAIERFRSHFGDDALATLMDKARRGDGMSDSLPATIDGRREAALASGEFVIPADVVSGLGNGSSQAGARELELMMARIRKARTGTAKQAPALKAGGLLPS